MQDAWMLRSARGERRLIVGISGASGAIYGVRLLELLRTVNVATHLILSKSAAITLAQETEFSVASVEALADHVYQVSDIGAAISSGSFRTMGMIIAPCSVKTMSELAAGITGNLMSRAADVVLKERRRLVLMVRETPLNLGHINGMLRVTEMGAIICPPVPAFYSHPQTLAEMVDHTLGRVLDLFDIDPGVVRRWEGRRHARSVTGQQSN